jgi:hypothetical protein
MERTRLTVPDLFWDVALVYFPALFALAVQVITVFTEPLNHDEAFNLQVSLNVALGNGYQTWYGGPHPLDLRITTGPTVLLPAAAVLRVLPPTAEAGRLVMTLFFVAFLVTVYYFGKLLLPRQHRLFFLVSIFFLLGIPTFNQHCTFVLGEVPSITFYLLGLIAIAPSEGGPRTWSFAGFCFGLAVLTKISLLLCFPILLITLGMVCYPRGLVTVVAAVGLCTVGSALPLLVWHGYKLSMLGWPLYQRVFSESVAFAQLHGSGAESVPFAFGNFGTRVPAHLAVLSGAFGRQPVVIGVALLVVLSCAIALWLRHGRPPLGFAIIGSASLLSFWWLAVSDWNLYRHSVPGYVFVALTCAYILAKGASVLAQAPWAERVILAIGFVGTYFCLPAVPAGIIMGNRILTPSPPSVTVHRQAQQDLAALVRQIREREPQASFWAYGWYQAPEISYLAAVPFQDITADKPVGDAPHYLVVGPHLGATVVDIFAAEHCANDLYRAGFFRMCRLKQ